MRFRKWYFATNVNGLRQAFDQITVAVLSCRAKAGLLPFCVIDDSGADAEIEARIRWLEMAGVAIIRHRASMLDLLRPKFGDRMDIYSGHWLRCDIPQLETEDDFVLYTDIDVMFLGKLPDLPADPLLIACGPEHDHGDYRYFNSGVLIINIPGMRALRNDLLRVVEARLPITHPWDDQSALNDLLRDRWLRLPPEWNWKPYWGQNDDALILHFHGPKPGHALSMQAGHLGSADNELRAIYERSPAGYAYYLPLFQDVLEQA